MKLPLVQYLSRAAQTPDGQALRIGTILSIASKLGPASEVLAFNRSLAGTCCAPRANGIAIASRVCRARCYSWKTSEGRDGVLARDELNDVIAVRPDFVRLVVGAIRRREIRWLRVHDRGDFDSIEYINKWYDIVSMLPDVTFWAYSRVWRDRNLLPALLRLASLPNIDLLLSCDRETGLPSVLPDLPRAWLADTDYDYPPAKCLVVLRGTNERSPDEDRRRAEARKCGGHVSQNHRNVVPLKVMNKTPVCPLENGQPVHPAYQDCISCRLCMPKARRRQRR